MPSVVRKPRNEPPAGDGSNPVRLARGTTVVEKAISVSVDKSGVAVNVHGNGAKRGTALIKGVPGLDGST